MCGLFGSFIKTLTPAVTDRIGIAQRMLRHRGPDDDGLLVTGIGRGTLALGHTRLSILDLTAGGRQPMSSPDARYTIVFNGEIFNYKELQLELRDMGFNFRSNSDTEVLLAAWQMWGVDCLPRLVGMFSLAVLDREFLTLTCARDAFGIKPFYYVQHGGDFSFASELPALRALMPAKAQLNWQRCHDYLVQGVHDRSPETFFDGMSQLMPGHYLIANLAFDESLAPRRWWTPQISERINLGFEEAAQCIRENFLNSVRLHLRSDMPVGAALSGGVDSSAVVCAMRHVSPDQPIHTFSYIAKDSSLNEEKWVDIVNRHVGAEAHKVVVTPAEILGDLDELIKAQGEPFGSMSIYAQYRVYKLAKEHGITVTLDGQGADEMLGGYTGFPGERIRSLLDTGKLVAALRFLDRWSRWPGRNMSKALRAVLAECSGDLLYEMMRRIGGKNKAPHWIDSKKAREMGVCSQLGRVRSGADAEGRRVVAQLANMLTRHGLPALLRYGDRNSMHFSIESRLPFLTLDQVNLTLSLPEAYLVSDSAETKHVFRRAMKGIVPDEILLRKDKIGFEPPERAWLMAIAPQARSWLKQDTQIPFLRHEAVLVEFDDIIAGRKAFSWQAWRWINFYRWKTLLAD